MFNFNLIQEICEYIDNAKDFCLNNVDAIYYALCFALGVFIVYLAKSQNGSFERVFNKLLSLILGFYYALKTNDTIFGVVLMSMLLLLLVIILSKLYVLFVVVIISLMIFIPALSENNERIIKIISNKIVDVLIVIVFVFCVPYIIPIVLLDILKLGTELLRYGYLSIILGFLAGIVVWKYDLLKISESSENEETNNHKKDEPKVLMDENDDYFGVWE